MRTAFIQQLVEEAKTNEKVFLLVGDLGYSVIEPFAALFPDRYLNVGIAEQNMTGIAAGLAMEGYNVFTYSIGNFPTLRCMEQIRYDVCYHNLSVKIVAVGGGYAYGPLGTSHHTTEDIAMLRSIPNMNVCAPADPFEARRITTMLCNSNEPCYLRLGKAGEPLVHNNNNDMGFAWGNMIEVKKGLTTAVLSTGGMLKYSENFISQQNNYWGLYSVPFIKPLDTHTLAYICNHYEEIITIEEHQKSGGFGSAILESINELVNNDSIKTIPKVRIIAIPDRFIGFAGTQEYLREIAGLKL
jgi:transketolase